MLESGRGWRARPRVARCHVGPSGEDAQSERFPFFRVDFVFRSFNTQNGATKWTAT